MVHYFSYTNAFIVLFVAYSAFVARQLYKFLNPLQGLDISGPTIDPLWLPNDPFSTLCYLSDNPHFEATTVSRLRQENRIIFENVLMHFNEEEVGMKVALTIASGGDDENATSTVAALLRTNHIVGNTALWTSVRSNNSNVFLHVVLTRHGPLDRLSVSSMKNGDMLFGSVALVKYDVIPKSFHYRYLLTDFGLVNMTQPEVERYNMPSSAIVSYWKPEVSVKIVTDFSKYPISYVPGFIRKNIVSIKNAQKQSLSAYDISSVQRHYKPLVIVDEIGLTSDKYIPLNSSVNEIPLQLSFTPMSIQRSLLISQLEQSFEVQKSFGFEEKDIDEVRRLISDTSLTILGITMAASALHLLFEFLAYQSDVSFWRENKSLAGLSVRGLFTDFVSQIIIFLYVVDAQASLLVTIPMGFGLIVQLWKIKRATGFSIIISGIFPRIMLSRLEVHPHHLLATPDPADADSNGDATKDVQNEKDVNIDAAAVNKLVSVTIEADKFATSYLFFTLVPLVLAYSVWSLVNNKHRSWYSWSLGSLTGCVYMFGFVLMVPQLYINHKLKSVAHLPWKVLIFKFINTFIDDLFAFIIKMPTMHRLSVFRDDIVFFIYIYQRYHYQVDEARPTERG